MKSQLLYILITLCLFGGIGAVINGWTRNSGQGARGRGIPNASGTVTVTTGILLISAGLLLLYLFNEQLTE